MCNSAHKKKDSSPLSSTKRRKVVRRVLPVIRLVDANAIEEKAESGFEGDAYVTQWKQEKETEAAQSDTPSMAMKDARNFNTTPYSLR